MCLEKLPVMYKGYISRIRGVAPMHFPVIQNISVHQLFKKQLAEFPTDFFISTTSAYIGVVDWDDGKP